MYELKRNSSLAEIAIIIPGAIGKNRRIHQLTATGAFPRIKGTNKIIEFLNEHTAFASWTVHKSSRLS